MTLPKVFGLSHLSEDAVAAFADGVLSPAATVRAQRHCDVCEDCAEAVRGQRETAMMLRAATAPSAPLGLLDRLAGVPMSAPLPPPLGGLPTVLGDDGVPMFVAYVSSQFSQSVPTSASSDEDSGSAAAAIQQGGAEAGAELVQPVIFAARTLPVSTDLHSARGTQPSP